MNSQTTKDIPCFRSYLPDALRLRFEDKLTIRAIAQRLGLSHSTIHTLFQRFLASGIAWPLPDSVSFAQLDAILYANRKKELTEPQIREGSWRKERRTNYSREFKVRLAKQALQPGAVVALKWHTEFGHLNRGDMLTSEQHRCSNEKKKF